MKANRSFLQIACSVALVIGATACGSDDDKDSAGTSIENSAVVTDPPVSTDPPADTVPAPAVPQQEKLDAGTTYRLGKGVIGRAMTYTVVVDGSYAFTPRGFFGATLDKNGTEALVNVTDLALARVFTNPVDNLDALQTPTELDAATTSMPADFLAYFAGLPSVSAESIETTEFAGFPARSMRFSIGPVDGGFPCFGVDRGSCLLTIYLASGVFFSYWDGDSGTLYEVTIDGRSVLVEVSDREGAVETAASIVIGD